MSPTPKRGHSRRKFEKNLHNDFFRSAQGAKWGPDNLCGSCPLLYSGIFIHEILLITSLRSISHGSHGTMRAI